MGKSKKSSDRYSGGRKKSRDYGSDSSSDDEEIDILSDSDEEYDHDKIKIEVAKQGSLPNNPKYAQNVIFRKKDGTFVIRNFKDIIAFTITNVCFFKGFVINMNNLFWFLPCKKYKGTNGRHPSGSISSLRWRKICRGAPGEFFRNSITVDLWNEMKSVSIKISEKKLQMCGSKTMEMGEGAAYKIIEIINESVRFIRNCRANPIIFDNAYLWLRANCRGKKVKREVESVVDDMVCVNEVSDYEIEWPRVKSAPKKYRYFVENMIERMDDLWNYSDMIYYYSFFKTADPLVISEKLIVTKVGRSMVNKNYNLGFPIDRVRTNIELIKAGIVSKFMNVFLSFVSISTKSEIPDDEYVIRRTGPNSKQKFIIYNGGKIMHTGQGGDAMEERYYTIIAVLIMLKDKIKPKVELSKKITPQKIRKDMEDLSINIDPDILIEIVSCFVGKPKVIKSETIMTLPY